MPNFLPEDQWKEKKVQEALSEYIEKLRVEHAKRVEECLRSLSTNLPTWK